MTGIYKTFTIMKTLIQNTIILALLTITVCYGLGVPAEGSPNWLSEVIWSKAVAAAAGCIMWLLMKHWNVCNVNELVKEDEYGL